MIKKPHVTKTFLIFILCFIAPTFLAQFSDSTTYYTGLNSSGTFNKTNIGGDLYNLNNSLKLGIKKKRVSLNSSSKWIYGKQNKILTNNDASSTLDFNLYKTIPHFYYWGLANYSTSYSLKVNHQWQTGIGVAYNFIDNIIANFNVSDGIIFEYSDVLVKDSDRNVYSTFRNSFRLSFKWNIKKLLFLTGTGYLQNSLNDSKDYIIKADLTLGLKIRRWLNLTANANYNKITKTNRENLFVTYGLTIQKYF